MPTSELGNTVPIALTARRDVRFAKFLVAVNAILPGAILAWDAARGQLGVNGVSYALHTTGLLALLFLVLTLLVTPLRKLTGVNTLLFHRRTLGLIGFGYACAHLVIFYVLDRALSVSSTVHELLTRRYLLIGTAGLLLMVPLAVTSTNGMVMRLGARRWKALHRLVYVAVMAGALHYYLLVKSDVRQPLAFAGALAMLLAFRLVRYLLDRGKRPLPVRRAPVAPAFATSGEVTIKRSPNGHGSAHLHDQILVGSKLKVSAPAGRFVFTGTEAKRVILIAGGVGITPLMSIIRYLTDRCWAGQIYLLFSAKTRADLIFADELGYLERRFPNLHVCHTLSREDRPEKGSDWKGERGAITRELLERVVPDVASGPVYLCGPEGMMAAVRKLLFEMGLPETELKTEAFVSPGVGLVRGPASAAEETTADLPEDAAAPDPSGPLMAPDTGQAGVAGSHVRFQRSAQVIEEPSTRTILEAAEDAGIAIPFECRAGVCGQCKTKLLSGRVTMESEDALSAAEKARGFILACQARALGNVTLDA